MQQLQVSCIKSIKGTTQNANQKPNYPNLNYLNSYLFKHSFKKLVSTHSDKMFPVFLSISRS